MKKRLVAIIMSMLMVILVGCSQETKREITDRAGNKVEVPNKIEKIISTAPSNTEIIANLGFADKLVAVDKYSENIAGVSKDVTKIDFSNPDSEAIIGLEPDLIIASGHNKTGSGEDPFKLVSESGIPVVYLPSSDSIGGIYKDIEFISNILDVKDKGNELVSDMKRQIDDISKVGATIKDKKSVYFEISPAPNLYTFGEGTFLNEMIEIIGANNVFADEKSWLSPSGEAVINKNPDVILTNVNYIDNPVDEIKNRDGFENITAVKNGDIHQIDTDSSSRPSNHIILALKQMAKAVYPEKYDK
ncbi:ABC transporter substrate-binding protein [Metaclostridioides mangenotii]|uniref:ABC transporter substrate-binding protein n=1 Tax=Metaclostridioides mangenotii TaxID=1540 RepID=UPI001F307770|nr:ABC transporter substrate-binding protein [Clostridioides mangenotii]